MIEYKLERHGLSVLLRVDRDNAYVDDATLLSCLVALIDTAECAKQFSLAIIKTETPND